jgi:hypothetical protein
MISPRFTKSVGFQHKRRIIAFILNHLRVTVYHSERFASQAVNEPYIPYDSRVAAAVAVPPFAFALGSFPTPLARISMAWLLLNNPV